MEGSRVAKKEGGSKLPWIIAGSVAGVLAAAYLGLCAFAMNRNAVLPNVSVSGIDVSNMTVEQAENTVRASVDQRAGDIKLTLVYEDLEESLEASQMMFPGGNGVQAFSLGRGRFLDSGWQLASHALGRSSRIPLDLDENDPALKDLMERMERTVEEATEDHGYQVEGDRLVMTKGAPVVTVDWNAVKDNALSALQEAFEEAGSGPVEKRVLLSASQSQAEEPDFDAIHRAVYTEARDAALDLEAMEITDHVVGVDFDVEALRTAYRNAKSGETFSIPLTVTQPKVTKDDLGGSLFRDVLGEATSSVSGSGARKSNVKLAAEACNNVILLPGEEFSYNGATGPRTAAKGYQAAPAYYNGATVQEIGGGVCQPSSTLYYAVLHTTLEITERHNHRYAVGYVPDGMDATVSYNSLDFKFKNNTDYPIKIVTSSYDAGGGRKLNVKIYGTNVDGVRVEPTNGVFNVVAPTVQYLPDANVARGSLVLDREQNAYRGRSAQTYRTVYAADGTQIERQDLGVSVYKMRPTVYHYNPADGDPATWPGGQPPAPGATPDPGTTPPPTDPGPSTDPGTAPDPGTEVDPPPAPDPEPELEPAPPPSDSGLNPLPNPSAA